MPASRLLAVSVIQHLLSSACPSLLSPVHPNLLPSDPFFTSQFHAVQQAANASSVNPQQNQNDNSSARYTGSSHSFDDDKNIPFNPNSIGWVSSKFSQKTSSVALNTQPDSPSFNNDIWLSNNYLSECHQPTDAAEDNSYNSLKKDTSITDAPVTSIPSLSSSYSEKDHLFTE